MNYLKVYRSIPVFDTAIPLSSQKTERQKRNVVELRGRSGMLADTGENGFEHFPRMGFPQELQGLFQGIFPEESLPIIHGVRYTVGIEKKGFTGFERHRFRFEFSFRHDPQGACRLENQ